MRSLDVVNTLWSLENPNPNETVLVILTIFSYARSCVPTHAHTNITESGAKDVIQRKWVTVPTRHSESRKPVFYRRMRNYRAYRLLQTVSQSHPQWWSTHYHTCLPTRVPGQATRPSCVILPRTKIACFARCAAPGTLGACIPQGPLRGGSASR